jgi:hypothetical protein
MTGTCCSRRTQAERKCRCLDQMGAFDRVIAGQIICDWHRVYGSLRIPPECHLKVANDQLTGPLSVHVRPYTLWPGAS